MNVIRVLTGGPEWTTYQSSAKKSCRQYKHGNSPYIQEPACKDLRFLFYLQARRNFLPALFQSLIKGHISKITNVDKHLVSIKCP